VVQCAPGVRLGGRYVLSAQIGAGGMSQVWRAVDEVLGRPVAVKVLDTSLGTDPAMRAALRREALAAARITHPHITRVFDFGEATAVRDAVGDAGKAVGDAVADAGTAVGDAVADIAAAAGASDDAAGDAEPAEQVTPYLVMELLEGEDLARQLRAGAMHWRMASRVGAQVAGAVAAAHRLGVVHRDIKPANVVLTPAGAKVVDFGIAALCGAGQRGQGDLRAGTPAFLAPELFGGAAATPASDVYGLGALLHAMLTGHAPIAAATWAQAVQAHETTIIGQELAIVGLPAPVRYLCLRCLARNPHSRPAAHEVAALLESAAAAPAPAAGPPGGRRIAASPTPTRGARRRSAGNAGRLPVGDAGRSARTSALLAGAVMIVVLVALSCLAFVR
jgi:eukaryotic-like serine/threonine-protein kinase